MKIFDTKTFEITPKMILLFFVGVAIVGILKSLNLWDSSMKIVTAPIVPLTILIIVLLAVSKGHRDFFVKFLKLIRSEFTAPTSKESKEESKNK